VASNDTIKKTLVVTLVLCIVCSVIVSTASVKLKPLQEINKELDFNLKLLQAAGIYDENLTVPEQFSQIETKLIDLRTGKFSSDMDITTYNQRKASKDSSLSDSLDSNVDIAGIKRLEYYSLVYLVNNSDGLSKVILPIRGYGLWSTLYGFLALENDLNTIVGIGYYEHGETPGLGGEVDNESWKAKWQGSNGKTKKIYGPNGDVKFAVLKGAVIEGSANEEYQVDGLSGASLTTKGVDNMIKFWLGKEGFGLFLTKLGKGEA
jgi:Na+-transporting NADH:ubiquinone oxidoreductase subunit C